MEQSPKRRSAVEPKIGHLKSGHRTQRGFLKGLPGDALNATFAAAGSREVLPCGRTNGLPLGTKVLIPIIDGPPVTRRIPDNLFRILRML